MANPYVTVIGNVCAGKTTFVDRFSASNNEWHSLPEILSEKELSNLDGQDTDYLHASFFVDYYVNRHVLSLSIPGPVIQESCIETSSLFPDAYYEIESFSQEKYNLLKSRYFSYLQTLPRPDFYIYLSAPVEVLLKRADKRKEPSRTLSKKLIPVMQNKLENWVKECVDPETLICIDTHEIDMAKISRISNKIQIELKNLGNHAS